MSVTSKVHNIQLVKNQPEERLAATSEELLEKLEGNIEDIKKQYILGSVKYAARV